MKYLVLGSAGQIGIPLCSYLKKIGHEVLTFDIVDDLSEDLRIPNNKKLDQYMSDCDFVFFLAWDVGGSRYLAKYQDTFDFIQNNIKIVSNTFDCIKKYNKPFLFASSQMANMSYSSYGVTKSLGEKVAASLNGVTVKFWNVYGPEYDLEKSHVITDFILKAKNNKLIGMLTDGSEQRQLLHATDCSKCLYILSTKYDELPRDQEYHITSFEWTKILDVAEIVASNFPGTQIVPANSKDMVQQDKRNDPDPFILNFWKPEINLTDGIKDIIDFVEGSNINVVGSDFWEEKHKLQDNWWLTGSDFEIVKTLHNLNDSDFKGKEVLEIGVGLGTCTKALSFLADKLYCCDISRTALANVSKYTIATYLTADLKNIPPVDIALCHLVFQHCSDDEIVRIINEVNLKNNGILAFQYASIVDNILSDTYLELTGKGTHFFRSKEEIEHLISLTNKELIRFEDSKWWRKDKNQWDFVKLKNKK